MSSKAQDPMNSTHRYLVAACVGSVPRCCSGFVLLASANIQIFHCCGNFLVRFLGTELDLMASGHQTGLKGDQAA